MSRSVACGRYLGRPRVTEILGVISKPALPPWYAKLAGQRAVAEIAELERRIRLDGPESARKWVSAAPKEARDDAATRGSDLHSLAERQLTGQGLPRFLLPEVRALVDGLARFLTDYQPVFTHTEVRLLNRTVGYGGTADFIAHIPAYGHVPVLGDWKTGRTGPYPEWALQVAAYTHTEAVIGSDDQLTPLPPLQDRALIVRILPGGYELHEVDTGPLFRVFKAAYVLWATTRRRDLFEEVTPASLRPPAYP